MPEVVAYLVTPASSPTAATALAAAAAPAAAAAQTPSAPRTSAGVTACRRRQVGRAVPVQTHAGQLPQPQSHTQPGPPRLDALCVLPDCPTDSSIRHSQSLQRGSPPLPLPKPSTHRPGRPPSRRPAWRASPPPPPACCCWPPCRPSWWPRGATEPSWAQWRGCRPWHCRPSTGARRRPRTPCFCVCLHTYTRRQRPQQHQDTAAAAARVAAAAAAAAVTAVGQCWLSLPWLGSTTWQ